MRAARLRRGLAVGAAVGAMYFIANLSGTFSAIGWLFDPTLASMVLLAAAGLSAIALAALIGGLIALLWPQRLTWRPSRKQTLAAVGVMFFVVAGAGFALREGRNLDVRSARPPVSAKTGIPILWVVIDTLRADVLYGPERNFPLNPSLRELASNALVFADAESSAAWTIPSTAALLTGIHNSTMDASAGHLPDWAPTIAERLRKAGYETRALVDNTLIEPRNGFAAGFESYWQRSGYRFAFSLPSFRVLPQFVRESLRFALPTSYAGSKAVSEQALSILDEPREHPLFLYVHYMDPHAPYHPHGRDPSGTESIAFWKARDGLREDASYEKPTESQMRLLRHRYAGEVRALDDALGQLLDAWHERYGRDGMILVTADHGEEFLEHGNLSHSLTVHREVIHVPLMLQLPAGSLQGAPEHGWVEQPVDHLSLVPTTLELAGVDAHSERGPSLYARSWIPWLTGRKPPPGRPLMANQSRHGRLSYRFREGRWVMIREMYYDERPTEYRLYDLLDDKSEQRDRFAQHESLVPGMKDRLTRIADEVRKAYDGDIANDRAVDEESLRALGYIQ